MKAALLGFFLFLSSAAVAVEVHTEAGDLYKSAEAEYMKGNQYNAKEQFLQLVDSEEYKGAAFYFLGYLYMSGTTNFKSDKLAIKYNELAANSIKDRPKMVFDALTNLADLTKGTKAGLGFALKAKKIMSQTKQRNFKYYTKTFDEKSNEDTVNLLIWQCAYQLSEKDATYKDIANKYYDKALGSIVNRGSK